MTGYEITVQPDKNALERIAPDLPELLGRCYQEKPAKKDLRALQVYLDAHPSLWQQVFDLTGIIRAKITENWVNQEAARMAIHSNIQELQAGMGYDQSPIIERLLIDSVINAWLRYLWAEMRYNDYTQGAHSMREGDYWLQVLGTAQRRYLRAIETLARVRRITRATMQINIAEPGSQQVNIAGDMKR